MDSINLSDKISSLALFISAISLIIGLFTIYLSKRIELVYEKFDKLCFFHVEQIFEGVDKIFKESEDKPMEQYRSTITDILVELQMFLVELKKYYPKINLVSVVAICNEFSDEIYLDIGSLPVASFKSKYFASRLSVFHNLYEFAIRKELSMIENLKFWKSFCKTPG